MSLPALELNATRYELQRRPLYAADRDSLNFDFLRANAVLIVLVFHVLAFYGIAKIGPLKLEAMGLFGVLLFFVHTSFVLMLSLERQVATYGRRRLALIFMLRRCFRIYPLSIFVVGVITLFRLPLAGPPWAMTWPALGVTDVLSNILLIQHFTGSPYILGPLWSLPFEMEMYICLPVLFLLARKLKSSWAAGLSWIVLSGITSLWLHTGHRYNLQYAPCFLAGIVAYRFSARKRRSWPFLGWPLVLWSSMLLFMWEYRQTVGWLLCLVVGMAAPQFREVSNRWIGLASHHIARYSYGIYLSHYFCIWLALSKLRFLRLPIRWLIFVSSVVIIPVVLYHVLELPLMKLAKKLARSAREMSFAPARRSDGQAA
jgi:peptidoglycan/LPS O-acetylase OafA/YrhL